MQMLGMTRYGSDLRSFCRYCGQAIRWQQRTGKTARAINALTGSPHWRDCPKKKTSSVTHVQAPEWKWTVTRLAPSNANNAPAGTQRRRD